jgi:putative transposase
MGQFHGAQDGLFHVTTNAKGRVPWCVLEGVPQLLIRDVFVTKVIHQAHIYAFCVLPDHMHILLQPGERGLSKFMKSFKENSSRNIRTLLTLRRSWDDVVPATGTRPLDLFTGWQSGFHDERIRDREQRQNALMYIENNARKHRLVDDMVNWPWTSLHMPEMLDPFEW